MSSLLTHIFAWPLAGAIVLLFLSKERKDLIRMVALATTAASLLFSVAMFFGFDPEISGYQYEHEVLWVESLGISYYVGVDGINVGLVLMGAIVGFAAVCVSCEIQTRLREYYFLLLLMISGVLGAFVSLDLFFLYFFHELALIPTLILVGVWGRGENRNYAAFMMTLYLSLGALISLVGILLLYIKSGTSSFNIQVMTDQLIQSPLSVGDQLWIFGILLLGFGILVSLWPFHSWAPIGYGAAPTAVAMVHAGVLKKFGIYSLIRIAVPLLPAGMQGWLHVIAFLCLGNILYCGLVAIRQKDLNLLIGNSSVAHMGFVFLGIAALNVIGITGAVVVMVAHGLLAALSFGISGYLCRQTQDPQMDRMAGMLSRLPFIGTALIMALLAGCGLPGFGNFVGELLVFFGAIKSFPVVTAFALWGALVIGAVYMLRAVRTLMHGEVSETAKSIKDAETSWQRLPFVLLLGVLLLFGCFPGLLTDKIRPSVEAILEQARQQGAPKMEGKAAFPLDDVPENIVNFDPIK